jgi:putative redox protein
MSGPGEIKIAHVTASIGNVAYKVSIEEGRHRLTADESKAMGGQDEGPPPFGLLLSALGACTSITLKMYAERKAWPLESLTVDLRYFMQDKQGRIERVLRICGDLNDEQRARLADIAERTPVTLAIRGGVPIATTLG